MQTLEFDLTKTQRLKCDTKDGPITVQVLDINNDTNEVWLAIDGPRNLTIRLGNRQRELWGAPHCTGPPRIWLLFSLVLSHAVRHTIFMPAFMEFVEDYLFTTRRITRPWERRWITFAYTIRTLCMIASCLRIQFCGHIRHLLVWLCHLALWLYQLVFRTQ